MNDLSFSPILNPLLLPLTSWRYTHNYPIAEENTLPHDPPPLHSAVDTPWHGANGLRPRESSTRPTARKKKKTLPQRHTHSSSRQLASYQGKWKHTLLHTPLLGQGEEGGRRGENVPALIRQLTGRHVWKCLTCAQHLNRVATVRVWGLWKWPLVTSKQGQKVITCCPVTLRHKLRLPQHTLECCCWRRLECEHDK